MCEIDNANQERKTMRRFSLDPSDSPEQSTALVSLATRYLHDMAKIRLADLPWSVATIQLVMGNEIAMLDYLALAGAENIAQAVLDYHNRTVVDFPRPMGVLP